MSIKNKKYKLLRIGILTLIIAFILPSIAALPTTKRVGSVSKIVIDAGHGGKDSGNLGTGRYRAKEKHISLEVALMVGNYIKKNIPGVEVVYTRDKDEFIGLKERAALANRLEADLFMSIHCNAHTNGRAYGTETFVMGLSREKANIEIARKENSVILLEDNHEEKYEGFDPNDPQGTIMARLSSNIHLDQSALLAKHIQDQFRERVQRHDRGVKQSVLYVLDFSAMPSVLIELGFLTNRSEEDFLNTKNGKELMASAIYRAFKAYKLDQDELDKLNTPAPESLIAEELAKPSEQPELTPNTVPEHTKTPVETTQKPSAVAEKKVVYKIQIGLSTSPTPTKPENFKQLAGVEMYQEEGNSKYYKYTYGKFSTLEEANKNLPLIRAKGFTDAFIVAFLNGKRIDLNKAAEIQ